MIGEHIDVKEWLGQKLDDLYPHRVNRPDISRNNGTYQSQASMLPIDIMLEKGIITGEHHRTAIYIYMLRLSIASRLGFDRIMKQMGYEDRETELPTQSPSVVLTLAFNGLSKMEANLIDKVTALPRGDYDRDQRHNNYEWLSKCYVSVRKSLEHAQKNLDLHVESAKNDSTRGGGSV